MSSIECKINEGNAEKEDKYKKNETETAILYNNLLVAINASGVINERNAEKEDTFKKNES